MAELTFRASTSDNRVECSGDWATAIGGGSASLGTVTDTTLYIGYENLGSVYISEYFTAFDTSAIPAGSTVSAVTFSMTNPSMIYPTSGHIIEVYAYDWGEAVGTGDWRTGGSAGQLTALYNGGAGLLAYHAISGNTDPATHAFTVNAAMNAAIVCGGTTRFVIGTDDMRADTQGGAAERGSWATGDHATEGSRPTLVVTYTAPVGFVGLTVTKTLNG